MDAPRIIERRIADADAERRELVEGLLAEPARISPKYFYDAVGSALYGAICELPEYYPTRTETALFEARREEIAACVGAGRQLVDLGAGDSRKAEGWVGALRPSRYIAVDIAAHDIARSLARLRLSHPALELVGVATDFSRDLDLGDALDETPALFFYPGSSIGNYSPAEAVAFMARIHALCAARPGSGLLIGVDGKKDKATLDAAYDDALGVTAAFNRNVLRHLNRLHGFGFDVTAFGHRGFYDETAGRIEMHLESLKEQAVLIDGRERRFPRGARIHTENSWKYAPEEFEALLGQAGFGRRRRWDAQGMAYQVWLAA